MGHLFGTAGVRGVTNREITPEFTMRVAALAARQLEVGAGRKVTLGVGHDTRWGADVLARAAIAGACATGANAVSYGVIPTGAICLNIRQSGYDGGILITGSHMPPERTGVIVLLGDGSYAPHEFTDPIEEGLRAFAWEELTVSPDRMGHPTEAFHPFETYISHVVGRADARAIRARRLRVLCDPANGPASLVAQELLQWLGCEVTMIHHDPAPVPARPSEPRASTVHEARRTLLEKRCDVGFCFDVDADRCLVIDERGEAVSEDTLGALLARQELRAGDLCVVPINSSGLIELACEQIGARLEYCEVGQPKTVQAIKRLGAAYAYEESGKYYFPRVQMWTDGLFTAVRLLEMMARTGRRMSELAAEFPPFHQVKNVVPVPHHRKDALMARVRKALRTELKERMVRDYELDGLKRTYEGRAWLLVRPSGTEELVRVYSDAPDAQRARQLADAGAALVRRLAQELD